MQQPTPPPLWAIDHLRVPIFPREASYPPAHDVMGYMDAHQNDEDEKPILYVLRSFLQWGFPESFFNTVVPYTFNPEDQEEGPEEKKKKVESPNPLPTRIASNDIDYFKPFILQMAPYLQFQLNKKENRGVFIYKLDGSHNKVPSLTVLDLPKVDQKSLVGKTPEEQQAITDFTWQASNRSYKFGYLISSAPNLDQLRKLDWDRFKHTEVYGRFMTPIMKVTQIEPAGGDSGNQFYWRVKGDFYFRPGMKKEDDYFYKFGQFCKLLETICWDVMDKVHRSGPTPFSRTKVGIANLHIEPEGGHFTFIVYTVATPTPVPAHNLKHAHCRSCSIYDLRLGRYGQDLSCCLDNPEEKIDMVAREPQYEAQIQKEANEGGILGFGVGALIEVLVQPTSMSVKLQDDMKTMPPADYKPRNFDLASIQLTLRPTVIRLLEWQKKDIVNKKK